MSGYGVDALAFGPHPDDVELFAGGTLIRLAELGYATGVVDLSRGELASRGTPEVRAAEAEAAARVMGLAFRENLGLPDGFIASGQSESEEGRAQVMAVVEVLRRRRPELVLIPWIEDRHPDHAATASLVTRALFYAGLARLELGGERFAPRQALYYGMRHRMAPSFVMDTSGAFAKKLEAIRCHASQLAARPGEPQTLIGSARALDAIEARDRYYGSMIGASHGEPLRAPNTLGLADPVAHFRSNPFPEAHAFEALR